MAHPPDPGRAIGTPSGQEGMFTLWIGFTSLQAEKLSRRGLGQVEAVAAGVDANKGTTRALPGCCSSSQRS